jgi:hypothetical protein
MTREGGPGVEPITIEDAAARLHRTQTVIRKWVSRYHARKIGIVGGRAYYDYDDLATIEACIHRGQPVPASPDERDALRDRARTPS